MPTRKGAATPATGAAPGFTREERAAMRERVRELRAQSDKENGEREVRAKIAGMAPADRLLAERVHALVTAAAPRLAARTWYGMPAYAKDGQIVCYFRDAAKFKTRYATLGFSDEAQLDDGRMWATEFALTAITPVEEARILALLKRAVG